MLNRYAKLAQRQGPDNPTRRIEHKRQQNNSWILGGFLATSRESVGRCVTQEHNVIVLDVVAPNLDGNCFGKGFDLGLISFG